LDGFFVSFAVGKASGLVEEEEVSGIGSAMGNAIIRHFFVKLRPLDIDELVG